MEKEIREGLRRELVRVRQALESYRQQEEAILTLLGTEDPVVKEKEAFDKIISTSSFDILFEPEEGQSKSRKIVNSAIHFIKENSGKPQKMADIVLYLGEKKIGDPEDEQFKKMVRSVLSLEVKRETSRLKKGREHGFYALRQEKGAAGTAPQQTSI